MKVLVLLAAILPCISCQILETQNDSLATLILGGPTVIHPGLTDPEVVFAVEAINDMYKKENDPRVRYAVCIPYATSQVMATTLYTLDILVAGLAGFQVCKVKVGSRPWPNSTLVLGEPIICVPKTQSRKGMLGAPTVIHPGLTDPEVVFAVQAINDMYKMENDFRTRYAVCIPYATSQIVAGVMYTFDILVTGQAGFEFCHVKVWRRTWLYKTQVHGEPICVPGEGGIIEGDVSANSNPELLQGMPGGQVPTNLSDPMTRNAYKVVEIAVNARSGLAIYVVESNVTSITKQAMSVIIIYRFTGLVFSPTNCTNPPPTTSCQVDPSASPVSSCDAVVYWDPRETPEYVIQNLQCHDIILGR